MNAINNYSLIQLTEGEGWNITQRYDWFIVYVL